MAELNGLHKSCLLRYRSRRFAVRVFFGLCVLCALSSCASTQKNASGQKTVSEKSGAHSASSGANKAATSNQNGANKVQQNAVHKAVASNQNGAIPRYTLITIEEKSGTVETSVVYPEFENAPQLNEQIKAIVQKRCALVDGMEADWKEHVALWRETGAGSELLLPYWFMLESEPIIATENRVSVLFNCYHYSGGAHGNVALDSLTYDFTQNRVLSVLDVCGCSLEELARYCYDELCRALCPLGESNDWIKSGTEAKTENFSCFTYDGETVTIYFEPYEVAPWAYGIQTVVFPLKR